MLNLVENAVFKTLVINFPVEKAFTVFTDRMGSWWPATHHIGSTPFRDILVEHRTGGRWYEIDAAGEQCQWGTVLAWDPPHRVVVSWHLGPDWTYDPDLNHASEVELKFISETATSTRVEFSHGYLDRHRGDTVKMRDEVGGPGGWQAVLAEFQRLAEQSDQ